MCGRQTLGVSGFGIGGGERVFLVLSYILLVLLDSPGNGCYFLRNLAFTMLLLVCKRKENSAIMYKSLEGTSSVLSRRGSS